MPYNEASRRSDTVCRLCDLAQNTIVNSRLSKAFGFSFGYHETNDTLTKIEALLNYRIQIMRK